MTETAGGVCVGQYKKERSRGVCDGLEGGDECGGRVGGGGEGGRGGREREEGEEG